MRKDRSVPQGIPTVVFVPASEGGMRTNIEIAPRNLPRPFLLAPETPPGLDGAEFP